MDKKRLVEFIEGALLSGEADLELDELGITEAEIIVGRDGPDTLLVTLVNGSKWTLTLDAWPG